MTDDTRSRWEKWRRDPRSYAVMAANQLRRKQLLLPLASFTLTVQAVYPSRVLVSVAGLNLGQLVTVTRTPAGSTTRTPVRNLDNTTARSDAIVSADAELPFGVALTYILTIDEVDQASVVLGALSLDKVALSDAITGNAAEVVILAWPEKRIERQVSVFPIGGRNIVVSGQSGGFSSTIDLFVETDASKNNVLNLFKTATSGIIQIRTDQSLTSDGVDCYVVPTSWSETRYSQDGTDERRIISMDVVESAAWAGTPTTSSSTTYDLGDIAAHYPGGTLANIASDYSTLLGIAGGTFD